MPSFFAKFGILRDLFEIAGADDDGVGVGERVRFADCSVFNFRAVCLESPGSKPVCLRIICARSINNVVGNPSLVITTGGLSGFLTDFSINHFDCLKTGSWVLTWTRAFAFCGIGSLLADLTAAGIAFGDFDDRSTGFGNAEGALGDFADSLIDFDTTTGAAL